MLNNNGLLFAQYEYFNEHNPKIEYKYHGEISPPSKRDSEKNVEKWAESIKHEFPHQLEIQLGRGIIRLLKKEGAPKELPPSRKLFESRHES